MSSLRCALGLAHFLLATVATLPSGALPAFPGAQGYGAHSKGGREGTVLHVRNRCDYRDGLFATDCPGLTKEETLRWAVERPYPRTIVFDVGGEILLKRTLYVTNGFLTIAGQSAPSPGITLRPDPTSTGGIYLLNIRAEHVIVRHVRFRQAAALGGWLNQAILAEKRNGVQPRHLMLDHISASWATDDTIALQNAKDVTLQWSIVSESLQLSAGQIATLEAGLRATPSTCKAETPHALPPCTNLVPYNGKGMLVEGSGDTPYTGRISIHHNLFAHHYKRMPGVSVGTLAGEPDQHHPLEIVNNVMHDYRLFAIPLHDGECESGPSPPACPAGLVCVCQPSQHTVKRKLRANVIGNSISLSEETLETGAFTPTGSYGPWLPVTPYGVDQPWIPRDIMFEFEIADPDPPALPALSEGMEIYLDDNESARRDYDDDEDDEMAELYAYDAEIPICTTQNGKYADVIHCDVHDYVLSEEDEDEPHPVEADAEFGLPPEIEVQERPDAFADVLAYAGALYRSQDPVDQRAVTNTLAHAGTFQTDPNPTLTVASGEHIFGYDTDGDGIPNADEPTNVEVNDDADDDGYTNIEESLNDTILYPLNPHYTSNDGWDGSVQETSETSGMGGVVSSSLKVGDSTDRKQWVALLSFDTSNILPDKIVRRAVLTVTASATGGQPASLGPLLGDVQVGTFGSQYYQSSDFQEAADYPNAVTLTSLGGGVYEGTLDEDALAAVNETGRIEIRLHFTLDDDNDAVEDSLVLSTAALPKLTVSLE
jgi:hypothetical protein